MRERIPGPLFAISNDDGSSKPERTEENMGAIERNVVAAELIAWAFSYGARAQDIGPLLSKECPEVLVNPAVPIEAKTINGRTQLAHKRAQAQRDPSDEGDRQQNYIDYLRELHKDHPLPPPVIEQIREKVQTHLREIMPRLYWTKDDKCRALMLPLLDGLQKTGDEKVYPTDIARVVSTHLGKPISKTIVTSYLRDKTEYTMFKTLSEDPAPILPEILAWGRTEAPKLLKQIQESIAVNMRGPRELDRSPEGKALASALLELRLPIGSINAILANNSFNTGWQRFSRLLERHGATDDPYTAAAEELARDVPQSIRDAARIQAQTAWEKYRHESFENKYLKAEVFQTRERRALLAVLLDETTISPYIIAKLMNDRYGLDTNLLTIRQFVKANGDRTNAATMLALMTTPAIGPELFEQARSEWPALLAQHEATKRQNFSEGAKRRQANVVARRKAEATEAQLLAHPTIQQLYDDMRNAPKTRHEYSVARVAIARSIDAQGKPTMADGITITLANKQHMETDETRATRERVKEFLLTLMTDVDAGSTNVLSTLLDANKYEYIQLRDYGEKRNQFGGMYKYPIQILKTVFRPRSTQ